MGARRASSRRTKPYPPTLKRLGQHFLHDPRILGRIADSLDLTGVETVVEIGGGRGALTEQLLARAGRVITIEVDRKLAVVLRDRFAGDERVTVVEADVLAVSLGELAGGPYVVAANVPYYITTPLLFHALVAPRPERAVYLVQKEVAERVVAAPGSRTFGALSVTMQAVARIELLFGVPPGAFQPPPKVESAVIRVTPRSDPLHGAGDDGQLKRFVQAIFGQRRKQMHRILSGLGIGNRAAVLEILAERGIDPTIRPERLSPEDFVWLLSRTRAEGRAQGAGEGT